MKGGIVRQWLSQADTNASVVSEGVNEPLLEELGKWSGFEHTERDVEAFRTGAPILRHIPAAASAVPQVYPTAGDPDHLASQCTSCAVGALR